MTTKELFGSRIRTLRINKGWTQEFLAEKINITSNYLSSIERGKENPTFDMIVKLSNGIKVEMWELFDFGHEVRQRELREMLKKIAKETNEEMLRLAVKVLRAIAR